MLSPSAFASEWPVNSAEEPVSGILADHRRLLTIANGADQKLWILPRNYRVESF